MTTQLSLRGLPRKREDEAILLKKWRQSAIFIFYLFQLYFYCIFYRISFTIALI